MGGVSSSGAGVRDDVPKNDEMGFELVETAAAANFSCADFSCELAEVACTQTWYSDALAPKMWVHLPRHLFPAMLSPGT
jgi:hypothetical protein